MVPPDIEEGGTSTKPTIEAEEMKQKTYDWAPTFSKDLVKMITFLCGFVMRLFDYSYLHTNRRFCFLFVSFRFLRRDRNLQNGLRILVCRIICC